MSEGLPETLGLCPACAGEFHVANPEPGERCPHADIDHDHALEVYVRTRQAAAGPSSPNPGAEPNGEITPTDRALFECVKALDAITDDWSDQAAFHDVGEAIRVAASWGHRNEDARVIVGRLGGVRDWVLGVSEVARAALAEARPTTAGPSSDKPQAEPSSTEPGSGLSALTEEELVALIDDPLDDHTPWESMNAYHDCFDGAVAKLSAELASRRERKG